MIDGEFADKTFCFSKNLFRLAYARLGSSEDAEDLVQETYIKAFRSYSSFRGEARVQTWLTQILLNCIRDFRRKTSREPEKVELHDELFAEGNVLPLEQGPEAALCRDEIDPVLLQALHSMPDTLLIPLLLREIGESSYDDIASALDIPIGTVMSRLFRARALLRKSLSPSRNFQNSITADKKESPNHDLR